MSIAKERFTRGIILKADDIGVDSIEGELKVGTTSKKLHAYLDGALRSVVTETQSQTLTNKTVVVANNTITTAASGNLAATELNAALAELQGDIDTINTVDLPGKVVGPASSTDNAITRYDGTTGKLVKNSSVTVSDTGVFERSAGLTFYAAAGNLIFTPVTTGQSDFNYRVRHLGAIFRPSYTDTTAGANVTIDVGDRSTIVLTSATSVDMLTPSGAYDGQVVTLVNGSPSPITINNETGAVTGARIRTGTGTSVILPSYGAFTLQYSTALSRWSMTSAPGVKGPTTSVDNTLPRFDGTTGHLVQGSNVVLNDLDEMSGLTKLVVDDVQIDAGTVSTIDSIDLTLKANSIFDVVIDSNVHMKGTTRFQPTTDAATTGANATIPLPTTRHIRLTNVGLTSIDMIQSPGGAQEIILENMLTTPITINNNTGATLSDRIMTGTGGAIKLAPSAALFLTHDGTSWRLVGGTGGSTTITKVAGEALSINDLVYISTGTGNDIGRNAGEVYKVDPTNDDRIEVVGFVASAAVLGGSVDVTVDGIVDIFSGLTAGKMYFADPTTPGAITATPPSTAGQWAISAGLAVSATEIIVNQCASATAQYIQESDISFTIANAQSVAANVTDLLLDGGVNRSFIIDYTIYRKTDTALSAVAQAGQLRGVYNTQTGTWFIGDDYVGQNSGVDFSITVGGQIQYTSSNIAGTNYSGTLKYNVRKTFEV